MVSVAFEVKLTLGSSAVVGQRDAVMLGLLGGEKGCAHLFGQIFCDKVAVLCGADGLAQRLGQRIISGADRLARGEQVFLARRRKLEPVLDAVQTCVDEQGEYDVGIDAAVERAQLEAVGLAAGRERDGDERRAVLV